MLMEVFIHIIQRMKGLGQKTRRQKRQIVGKNRQQKEEEVPEQGLGRYEALVKRFQAAEIPHQNHLFVRNIALSLPAALYFPSLLPTLLQTATAFMLNELEVVVWSLFLTRIVWQQEKPVFATYLAFSALSAKQYFDTEVATFSVYLRTKMPAFDTEYEQFRRNFGALLEVSPKEMRDRFEELRGEPAERVEEEPVDYNQMIVAILQMSPPLLLSLPTQECTPSDLPRLRGPEDPRTSQLPSCTEPEQEFSPETEEAFRFWEIGTPIPRLSSLSEIWPDLSPKKRSEGRKL